MDENPKRVSFETLAWMLIGGMIVGFSLGTIARIITGYGG